MNWSFRLINTALMSVALSCLMTLYVTWIHLGINPHFLQQWLKAWLLAAPAAFFGVLILAAPTSALTRKLLTLGEKLED